MALSNKFTDLNVFFFYQQTPVLCKNQYLMHK